MKTFFIALSLMASSILATANGNTGATSVVQASFENHFSGATEVKWETAEQFFKAEFVHDGQAMAAYFSNDGVLVATMRNISSDKLPVGLRKSLQQKMKGRWITDLFSVTTKDGVRYYVRLENSEGSIDFTSVAHRKWVAFND